MDQTTNHCPKRILLITTGGTVACRDEGAGLVPVLGPEALLAAVPDVRARCAVTSLPLFSLDSTDMTPAEWLVLARAIRDRYADYDGFVITHGTDTLAYAAATLSCLLRAPDKPVALTGSQLPLETPGSDAPVNLSNAFTWVLSDDARGVHIVFAGRVIRGLRARKRHTTDPDAFESVNCPDTARIIGDKVTFPAPPPRPCGAYTLPPLPDDVLDTRVALVHLTPGMDPDVLWRMAAGSGGPALRAVIVEGVGIGGIPDALTPVLTRVAGAGIRLVLTSQVPYGACDFTVYRVGRRVAEAVSDRSAPDDARDPAVVTTRDVPSEAAFAASMWALSAARTGTPFSLLFEETVREADI